MTNEMQNRINNIHNQVVSLICKKSFPHGALIECQNTDEGEDFARFVANALICTGENKPCNACPDCIKAQGKGHPDIFETDGIKENSKSKVFAVDSIRKIRDDAFILPNESDKKIYILKNGSNMNEQAQNAFLKILEEPPSYVYFIIVVESKSTMLETILSRVQIYSLLGDESAATEKELAAVKEIVGAILNVNELALMEQTAIFLKNNRFAKSVISLLAEIFRDALVRKSGYIRDFRFPEESEKLCKGLTAKSLLQLIAVCNELVSAVDRNCNNNLLVVRMCYEFKRAIGR